MRRSLALFISVCILSFLVLGGMNMTGFCWSEKRWLSDDERINRALKVTLNQTHINLTNYANDGAVNFSSYPVIQYKNLNEFHRQNPDCCKVSSEGGYDLPAPTILQRITGENSGKIISLAYKMEYLKSSAHRKSTIVKSHQFQSNCGN